MGKTGFFRGLEALLVATALATHARAESYGTASAVPWGLTLPRLEMDGPLDSKIRVEAYNRLRGEFVDWFATSPTSTMPTFRYNFLGNKFQLGVRVKRDPVEVFVQFQDSALTNLPDDGVGVGSIYYANTQRTTQNGAILRNAWLRGQQVFDTGALTVTAGRQLYSDALDAPAQHPHLRWIQTNRLSQRLIGPFDYTHIGRSFDGGQLAYSTESFNVTGFGFRPTYGGYEVDANRELDITLGGVALNLRDSPVIGNMIGRVFWYYYGDFRDVLFLDNRPLPVRQADIGRPANIHTIGAHVVRLFGVGPGTLDVMAYGFGQFGSWQSQTQRAWAYGVEGGYQLQQLWAKPWMRLGINSAAGDTDPTDDLHGTFFQMLPTAWLYAQFPFYNMMNDQDVFVQWLFDPHPLLTVRCDLHWLRVNSNQDFAYFGGGATKNDFFGFGGVPADGRYELAYETILLLTVRATDFLAFNALYAHAFGQGVINANFEGRAANYGYLETVVSF